MTTNQGYVQTQCPRCGAAAWALAAYAVPCQGCGQQIGPLGAAPQMMAPPPAAPYVPPAQMPYGTGAGVASNPAAFGGVYPGSTPAPMPAAAPVAAPAPAAHQFAVNVGGFKIPFKVGGGAGGVSKFKIIGGVVLVIALSIAGVIFKMKFGTTAKGNVSYSSLGVDHKKPDGDKLIASLATPAKKWKRDAIWWSANYQSVDAEGRVDVSKGAKVVYISTGAVSSHAKSVRKDSIKKYQAGPAGVNGKALWGATEPWDGIEKHPEPTCKIKDVMAIVGKQLPAGKTVRITFDPKFADYYAWRVINDDLKIDTLYAFSDCSVIK